MDDLKDLKEAIERVALVRASSGIKIIQNEEGLRAQWLFDFRALLLQPEWLDRYAELFLNTYADRYPYQVCGMESAAISLVAAIVVKSKARGTPVNGLFIRKSRKRQGLMKQLEGTPTNDPVILVDDLINSGSTFNKQILILEDLGKRVSDVFALVRFRDLSAYEFARSRGITVRSPFSLEDFNLRLLEDGKRVHKEKLAEVWHFRAPDPSHHLTVQKSAPALDETGAYFGTDAGVFFALEQATGAVRWSFTVGKHPDGKGILSSPAIHAGVVYFGAYDGDVYALDTDTGTVRWKYAGADWVGSSPAIAPRLNLLYIGLEFGLFRKRGGIVALDLKSGKEMWSDRTAELTHGSPLYIEQENMVVIGSNDNVVYAYRATTGEKLWQINVRGSVKSSFAYDAPRRAIIFGTLDGVVYIVSAPEGNVRYAEETGAGFYSTPWIAGEHAYLSCLDKDLYAIDLARHRIVWRAPTNGRMFASPIVIEGHIWVGSNDGRLYEIDPQTGEKRYAHQFTEKIVNKIAYNPKTKRFFVPTTANEIYCLEQKA